MSRDGAAFLISVIDWLSKPSAAAASLRKREHFFADMDAVCAASRAISNVASGVGDGSIVSPRHGELKHSRRQSQQLVFASKVNGEKARRSPTTDCAPLVVNPNVVEKLLCSGGVGALPDCATEVIRRNAFQRLAGRSVEFFGSFHVPHSSGEKVRPDLHALSPSAFVTVQP
jgi:hypothetical protein